MRIVDGSKPNPSQSIPTLHYIATALTRLSLPSLLPLEGVLSAIDLALRECRVQISTMERNGRSHLPAFTKLMQKYTKLKHTRQDLRGGSVSEAMAPEDEDEDVALNGGFSHASSAIAGGEQLSVQSA